jgi:hypothetical protein
MEIFHEESEERAKPTVSREKWVQHARKKLTRGYVLIISPTRHNANFFKPGLGYEMCPYDTALRLVKEGIVAQVGNHHLGTVYGMVPETPLPVNGI